VRKRVTFILTFLAGAYFILEFLCPATVKVSFLGWEFDNPLTPYYSLAADLIIVIGTMAFLLGPINLVRSHGAALLRLRPRWVFSAVFLLFCFGTVIVAFGSELRPGSFKSFCTETYGALFYGVNFAFGTTSMGLLTFYLVSAAYRSFRFTGLDSAVMFVAATIVMLARTPLGDALTQGAPDALKLATWENWLMMTPNAAVQRAVLIGMFAGAFAASLRYWLGIGTRSE
jgi:hypothetical protein